MQFFSKTSRPWSALPALRATGWSWVINASMAAEDFGEPVFCRDRALADTEASEWPLSWLQ